MAEFIIVAIPVLLLGLAAFETARWFSANHLLSVALQQAGRAAIVAHGHPHVIQAAFEQGIQTLHPGTARRAPAAASPISWRIEILSPAPLAFADFADPGLRAPAAPRLKAINNHYLAEQHARYQRQGWAGGRGPASGQTIYQANTLTLRLRYPLQPIVPGLKPVLRALGRQDDSYAGQALRHGYLPLVREISFLMQSHPVNWPLPRTGNITRPR